MRYAGQEHTVATHFEPGAGLDALLAAFHAAHEKAYTFRLPDTKVELVTFHLTAEIDTPRVGLPEIAVKGTAADAIVGQRELYTGDDGVVLAPVYDRDRLPAGAIFDGPALGGRGDHDNRSVGRATGQRRPFRSPVNRRSADELRRRSLKARAGVVTHSIDTIGA